MRPDCAGGQATTVPSTPSISDAVRSCVNACSEKAFCILEPENVRRDSKAVRVGLVDYCAVEGRRQPLVLPAPVVNPNFDEIHLLCRQLGGWAAVQRPSWRD